MSNFEWMDHFQGTRNFQRKIRVNRIQMRMTKALRWPRWPVLKVVWDFWTSIMDEGVYQTCKPRWGAMTFAYLNDGCKPTLWHSWRQVTHDHTDQYTGIYVSGAPRSLAEAQAWDAKWQAERNAGETEFGGILK